MASLPFEIGILYKEGADGSILVAREHVVPSFDVVVWVSLPARNFGIF